MSINEVIRTTTKDSSVSVQSNIYDKTEKDLGAYLFVHHTQDKQGRPSIDKEQIYFSVSLDGIRWQSLNKGCAVLESTLGELGLRDPHIIRSPENNKFYMVATDLNTVANGNWKRAMEAGSQSIMIWESTDLVNWSEQRMVKIAREDAGCCWAPESVYDVKTSEYMVHWASTTGSDNFSKQRIYCSRTKDFVNFTNPEIYLEKEHDVIDLTFIYYSDNYYRFYKDETTKTIAMEVCNTLDGDFKPITTYNLNDLIGYEGPAVFKFNNEEKFGLYLDHYRNAMGYHLYITEDLNKGNFKEYTSELKWDNVLRHGSVLPITMDEYNKLCNTYGANFTQC